MILKKKKIIIYILFTITLFIGLYFKENSSGGAKIDFLFLLNYIKNFSFDFQYGLTQFLEGKRIHSPVYYIIIGFFLNIFNSILILKIIYILVCSLFPFIFYSILKNKYYLDNIYIFYLSLIIFLSPYFRSSGIWLLGDNLSIIFFSLSVLFYVKSINNKKEINYFLCILFLILCSYIRYYYSVFIIFYLINFFKNVSTKLFIKLLLECLILAIPAILYFLYAVFYYEFLDLILKKGSVNFLQNSLIILSIIFFYILPIIFFEVKNIFFYQKLNIKYFVSLLIIALIIFLFDKYLNSNLIVFDQKLYGGGGGVFIKLFLLLNINTTIGMLFISVLSLLILDYFFKEDRFNNYLLLIILLFCFPLSVIYQKYLDPFFIILFFGLINSKKIKDLILKEKINLKLLFSYALIFLITSISIYDFV